MRKTKIEDGDLAVILIDYIAVPRIVHLVSEEIIGFNPTTTPTWPQVDERFKDTIWIRKDEFNEILSVFTNNIDGYKEMRQFVIEHNTPIHGSSLYFNTHIK
jgi:hypothetical protein